ncbi:uncharacterized protein LOC114285616 isoform X1 [Camellia sinensis]|uniref:uncharacterized protein LOC114285616 isoform X1 n=1 Tax=Camellia sinensis TaxID=4442 RepID=UPI001035F8B4|nr:uncharacterized protein LOC114285616 isoform X1 [Camellia sinensis]
MEYLIQRRRVRISGVGQDSEEGSDNSRSEEIIPSQRTESFRDNKAESGLQRQFSSEMSHTEYDSSYEGEFASAIAAAAFAIYSAEESNSESYQNKKLRDATEIIPISRVRTTIQDQFKPPESSQISNSTRFSGWEARDGASMRIRMDQSENWVSTSRGSSQAKADAWEKAAMAKIEKRYVKMNSAILAWESEKKMKAKLQMERKKVLSFDLFGKVIDCCNEEFMVTAHSWKWSHYVQASHCERPRTCEGKEFSSWLVNLVSKLLALFTFSHIFLCIGLHVGPPISL